MGLISAIFGGGKTAPEIPTEPRRKNAKPRNKSNKPNKLSKPRTNTSANNLLDIPGGVSRKSSLASVNARGKRSSSVPVRSDVDLGYTEDVGGDDGLGRGRTQERDKRASRLSSLFRSKSSTPSASIVLQDRPDDKWILDDNGGVDSLDNSDPLRRYSQMGLPSYAQDLPMDGQFSATDSTPDLHRSPSYIRYQQARLSLVAETSSAVQINDTLRRQRLAETEAILTRNSSIHSRDSNASKRHSMISNPSPALSTRMNSTEQVNLHPETYTAYSARRRSHLTPGVATRMSETKKGQRASRLQKHNPKARRQSEAASEPNQSFSHQPERSKTLPSEEEIYSYYYDENEPRGSPLEAPEMPEMLAPLQKPRFREDITETQRMSTPTDLRHIGSFELGSLRITNGSAATPNAANTPKARRGIAADNEADNVSPRTTAVSLASKARRGVAADSDVENVSPRTTAMSLASLARRGVAADSDVENASPRTTAMSLASLARRHPMEQGNAHEIKQPRQPEVNHADLLSIDPPSRSPSTATKQSVYSDVLGISRASSQRHETAPQIPGGASELADFYRLDIDFLPSLFSVDLSMPSSPRLEATSKQSAEQDELFEDAKSDLGVFEDAKSHLEAPSPPPPEPPRRQNDELYLPVVETVPQRLPAQTMNTSTHARLETLAVTDSGYSSYTSLGSVESSRSKSKLRDASESPTDPDSHREAIRQAERDVSSKPRPPKADFWRTQHAPSDMTRESQAAPTVPPPMREAPLGPLKQQMQMPPIPTAATQIQDGPSESRAKAELPKSPSSSATTSPKRTFPLQQRSTGNVLQKSPRHRPDSLTAQGRSNSDDTITPVKKSKWQRHSTQLSAETPITVQGSEEPEKEKVPAVPKQVSHTFKERARRLSGLKQTTSVSDNVEPKPMLEKRPGRFFGQKQTPPVTDNVKPAEEKRARRFSLKKQTQTPAVSDSVEPAEEKRTGRFSMQKQRPPVSDNVKPAEEKRASRFSEQKQSPPVSDNVEPVEEKPAPPPSKEEIQRSIRRKSSPALIPGVRLVTSDPSIAPSPKPSPSAKTRKPISPPKDDKDFQSRKDFERHITSSTTVATSLGASPYDAGVSAITTSPPRSQPPAPPAAAAAQNAGRPRRDRTGRIIGMDEESASNFARARSQVRAQEAERREVLVTKLAQSISEGSDSPAPVAVPNNSSFANQLAIQSQRTATVGPSSSANVPPVPTLNLPAEPARQSPLMKGKREKIGPPPSMMNGRHRKNGILGFWSNGSTSSKDATIEAPK
ncbi:hypothetical protein V490_02209, partial [Pseudogymnoascus sp. VKM F-3557]